MICLTRVQAIALFLVVLAIAILAAVCSYARGYIRARGLLRRKLEQSGSVLTL